MQLQRYEPTAVLLHWVIGLALLPQIALGFLLDDIAPRGSPGRGAIINLHKSSGIVLGLLIVGRLLWRLRHVAPSLPATMPAWQRNAAVTGHRALYACMLLMPASGFLGSNFSKHGVRFFGLALRPWGADLPQVYDVFQAVHIMTAWLFSALILGHVVIALKHALVDREPLFSRMWPGPRS